MKQNYTYTIYACYIGYIVQAIINNLPPLLFVTFGQEFDISVEKIALLISINFGVQIVVDFLAAKYVERIGYRKVIVATHAVSAIGLLCLGTLPRFMSSPYLGLVIAMMFGAIGGGLIEVLISPIVEAAPASGARETAMSLLHSFYCWGHVGVVLVSTFGFHIFGMEHWYYLPILWSIVPMINIFLFRHVPINRLVEEGEQISAKKLLSMGSFWIFFSMMICSGASEQAMSQWASYFAEKGLQQSKTVGDLLGPCFFAVMMGASRVYYGKFGEHMDLRKFMSGSALLCLFSYLTAALLQNPILALLGCGLCGLSVGIMWPGTFSLAAKGCPQGGTLMFALMALAGDVGCAAGPAVVSAVSTLVPEYGIKAGLAVAIAFPGIILLLLRNRK